MQPVDMLMLGLPSGSEWLIIAVVVLVLFGAPAMLKFARSLGRVKGEFTKAKVDFEREMATTETQSKANEAAKQAEEASQGPGTPTEDLTSTPTASDDEVRAAASDMGIEVEGKSVAELKAEIARRLA